ncbi:potassium channel family protein [Halomonas daqiaonensis]|uniref:Trk system potassium uptake protein TrkA n=1 Tax=Halomonas daqiaonensis TaxID=650850 RepID=A0A1H7WBV3_9GAMM|nr:TrkA family potassium uptake protein [Halomonas daqiaonensis]SEM19062.1 trk system potassium uptake protein TrkA [Halomonas daqiaonensis]
MSRKFAILGLGYFGITVAQELHRCHNEVLGVDIDEARVNAFSDQLSHAVIADITDENALSDLALEEYDAVVIDTDDRLEASLVCTLLAREQGAREIWVKAHSDMHFRLLEHLGADRIIYPEHDSGIRVAESLHYHTAVDFIDLGDRQFVVDLMASDRLCTECKTVEDLDLERLELSLAALKRGETLWRLPGSDLKLETGDHMVLIGGFDALRTLGKKL